MEASEAVLSAACGICESVGDLSLALGLQRWFEGQVADRMAATSRRNLWDKFACVATSDPGIVFDESRPNVNYWEPWYLGFDRARTRQPGLPTADNPRTGAYRQLIERGRDLHELHALIAPRPFLISGGAEDPPSRWIPLNHARAVNQSLGFTNRVALTHRPGHDPTEGSNEQIYAFFGHFLKPQADNPR